jgi:hypothetical protein
VLALAQGQSQQQESTVKRTSIVSAAALAAVMISLSAPSFAYQMRGNDCSGMLQCASMTLPGDNKAQGMGMDHDHDRDKDRDWSRYRHDHDDHGHRFKPYGMGSSSATPR